MRKGSSGESAGQASLGCGNPAALAQLRPGSNCVIEVQPTRIFTQDEAREFLASEGLDADCLAPQVAGKVIGAFVRAVKP